MHRFTETADLRIAYEEAAARRFTGIALGRSVFAAHLRRSFM
ncbi:hypothetical protein [Mesorhizobium sp.]|nr:hypothetical protein [Mesorhizobium sp.]